MASKRTHFRQMRGRRLHSHVKGQRLITLPETTLPAMTGSSVFPIILPVVQDWPHLSLLFLHTTQASKHAEKKKEKKKTFYPKCLAVFFSVDDQRKHFGSSSKIIQFYFCFAFYFAFLYEDCASMPITSILCRTLCKKKKKKVCIMHLWQCMYCIYV